MTVPLKSPVRGRKTHPFLVRLAVALFALRAMVPAGYMPDLGALGHGRVAIAICTAGGTKSLFVDEEGRLVDDIGGGKKARAAADCAFGTASALAFGFPPLVCLPGRSDEKQCFLPNRGACAAQTPVQGPPLGPRAPPAFLV